MEWIVLIAALSGVIVGYGLAQLRWRRYMPTRPLAEPASVVSKISVASPRGYEFTRENEQGEFVSTGELIPEDQSPHEAVTRRSQIEGISYGAQPCGS